MTFRIPGRIFGPATSLDGPLLRSLPIHQVQLHRHVTKPHKGLIGGAGAVAFPDSISNLVIRYRADQGITLNGSDVSQWDDLAGNADHLTQSTANDQPLYNATGSPAGDGSVTFDGSTEGMDSGAFASQTQPGPHVFLVVKQLAWGNGDRLFTSGDGMVVDQSSGTPKIGQKAEGAAGNHITATIGTWYLVQAYFNGSSSFMERNDDGVIGPSNTGAGASFTTITVGREPNASNDCNVEFAEILMYSGEVTGGDLADLKAYFASRYSLF